MDAIWIWLGIILASAMLILAVAAFVWWRIQTSEEKKLARRIGRLAFGDKLALGWVLFRDARVGVAPR